MGMELPAGAVSLPPQPASVSGGEAATFDERWAAWRAKGAAHDRALARKLAIAAPLLLIAAPVVSYVLIGR